MQTGRCLPSPIVLYITTLFSTWSPTACCCPFRAPSSTRCASKCQMASICAVQASTACIQHHGQAARPGSCCGLHGDACRADLLAPFPTCTPPAPAPWMRRWCWAFSPCCAVATLWCRRLPSMGPRRGSTRASPTSPGPCPAACQCSRPAPQCTALAWSAAATNTTSSSCRQVGPPARWDGGGPPVIVGPPPRHQSIPT